MSKRTRKIAAKPRKPSKSKIGGARPGSGPKPKLGAGNVRTVIKTMRLSTGEHEAQQAAVRRGGARDWAEWARPILNREADPTSVAGAVHAGGTAHHGSDLLEVDGQKVHPPEAA